MTNITELAQRMKAAAEKSGVEKWQVKRSGPGEYEVIVKGSLVKRSGWSTHRPVTEGVVDKKTADFIALANPANIRALVEALEKAQQQIQTHERAELTWMNALELPDDATRNDILPAIHAGKYTLRAANKRIGELESRTVTVKLPNQTEFDDPLSAYEAIEKCKEALTAAGIKWEAE